MTVTKLTLRFFLSSVLAINTKYILTTKEWPFGISAIVVTVTFKVFVQIIGPPTLCSFLVIINSRYPTTQPRFHAKVGNHSPQPDNLSSNENHWVNGIFSV